LHGNNFSGFDEIIPSLCLIMSQDVSFIILGGSGSVGHQLMRRMAASGLTAEVISRNSSCDLPGNFTRVTMDLSKPNDWAAPAGAVIISFLPLWLLSECLPRFTGIKSIIATGSTSRYSKANSGDRQERSTAARLEKAEEEIRAWAETNNVTWTILRPTMIYDCSTDKNITRMACFIKQWHFLPVAAPAKGLRQPIHADDVAKAALNCLNNPATVNKAFNISGGETLSYRAMAERIFISLGLKPRFVMLPTDFLKKAFQAAIRLGIIKEAAFGASIFQRMNEDLVFDTAEGLEILNYQPRLFNPSFHDML
jgi:nucleoside-diphosphate-sugar epimerase